VLIRLFNMNSSLPRAPFSWKNSHLCDELSIQAESEPVWPPQPHWRAWPK
jgi:hypothetical protein